MKPTAMIEDQENQRLVGLVRKIDEYLLRHQTQELFSSVTASLERSPDGNFLIQRKLGNGLRLRGELKSDKQTVTLRIFLDPLRFKSWTKALGPVEFFYMDPFGIEICYRDGRWKITVDKEEISWQDTNDIYEIACIEVRRDGNKRKLFLAI